MSREYDDYVIKTVSGSQNNAKETKIPVSQVLFNKKLVSVRGYKFSNDPHSKNNKTETNINSPRNDEVILKIPKENIKEHNARVTTIFNPIYKEEIWENKEKSGIIYKFSKILKNAIRLKKRIQNKCSVYCCSNKKKYPVHIKLILKSVRYKILKPGKVVKKKQQCYRHIWMPMAADQHSALGFSYTHHCPKGNMENGLKFNNKLVAVKENTPLVYLNDQKLPFSQKVAYGLGHFYNDICAAIWFTYALIFLQLVAEMGPVYAGFLLFIGQAVDAVTTPVAGYLLDRTVNRKIWHLIGSLMVMISFPLIFTTPNSIMMDSVWIQMVYFSVSISIFQIGWAIVQIAHLSLLPELTTLTEERAQLTAHRYTASMAAHILVYIVAWVFLSNSQGVNMKLIGPADSWRFLDLSIITSLIGLVATIVFHASLKSSKGLFPKVARTQDISSLKTKTMEFFKSPHLYSVAVIYTSSRLFMTLSLVYIPLFINETILSNSGALATVPLASFLVSAFAALIVKLCSDHCGGLRITYLVGTAFCFLGCILVNFSYAKTEDTTNVFGVAILFGAGSSITMVVSLCVTANLIGLDTECGAFVYSAVTFADKLLNGFAVIIIEEVKCDKIEECPYYYGGVLSYVNGGVLACGLIAVFLLPTRLFAAT